MSPVGARERGGENAAQALAVCRQAYQNGDYATSLRQSSRALALGGSDPLLVATVCYVRGNIEETQGRDGLALRTWASGLRQLGGNGDEPLRSLLAQAIDSLLARPRALLSYARSDAGIGCRLRLELARQEVRCIEHRHGPHGGDAACESLSEGLDLATVVIVLWSESYRAGRACLVELEAARDRVLAWSQIGAAPRLVLLRADDTPLPDALADLPSVDLRAGLGGGTVRELVRLARQQGEDRGLPPIAGPGAARQAPALAAWARAQDRA